MILENEFSRKKGALWQRYESSIARDLLATRLMVAAFRFWVLARNRVFKKKLGFNAKWRMIKNYKETGEIRPETEFSRKN